MQKIRRYTALAKSIALLFLAVLSYLLDSKHLAAQSATILSNPSRCDTAWALRDYTCPDNQGFFLPNFFNIQVSNAQGTALGRDVYLREVRLRIQHQWAADLTIRLISPSGARVILSMNNGGGDDNYGVPGAANCQGFMRFAVNACTPIEEGEAPFTDKPYLPQESFLNFNDNRTNPNGTWQLLICDDSQQDTGRLEFVELLFAPISCLPAQSLRLVNQDTTTAVLDWTSTDGCALGTSIVEYGPPGFIPGTGAQPGVQGVVVPFTACPPYALRGLAPDTSYDIYIRRTCNGGVFAENSCPVRVRTGCLPPKPTTLENFDNQLLCDPICDASCTQTGIWRNAPGSTFKWLIFKDPTPTPDTGPDQDISGTGNYAYIETTGFQCANGSRAILQSGCFQLDKKGSDTCHLSFYYHMFGSSIGTLGLEVSTNGGATWQSLWVRQGSQGNQWIKESLSLKQFSNGTLLQFRFVGIKGNGSLGDIGLDHIALHGSSYLGWPSNTYFADADADGFGNASVSILSCAVNPPSGYVRNNSDCNDQNANINPGRPEVPCDNIDNNCNGNADDTFLAPPSATGDTICSGEVATLSAKPVQGDLIFWYTQASGGTPISPGQVFLPQLPTNTGPTSVIHRFYAEAADNRLRCFSTTRTEVLVIINPLPSPIVTEQPEICATQIYDLNRTKIQDNHFTQANLAFYRALPINPANLIANPQVSPANNTRYFFEMTSQLGCKRNGEFTLQVNPLPKLSFSPSDSFNLCLESTQLLGALPSGGTGTYRYLWSTGAETAAIRITSDAMSGVKSRYQVTVSDAKSCSTVGRVVVTASTSIDSIRRSITDVTLCNGRNGSITIQPLGGLPPYTYAWSGGGIQDDSSGVAEGPFRITGLQQGSYRVTITDNSSRACRFILRNAIVNGPGIDVRNIDIQPVTCFGAKDGQISLEVRGNPRFRWSNGDTTAVLRRVSGGMYAVTITSGTCSAVVDNLQVLEPDSVRVLSSLTPPTCFASLDGRIDLSVFGGAGNFQYRWSNNSIREDLERVARGTHAVTITDGAGCVYTRSFSMSSPALLSIAVDSNQTVSCFGNRNGLIRVSGRGGTMPYRYNWQNGVTLPVIRNLAAGAYQVTITDANNCTTNSNINVTSPAPMLVQSGITQPKCFGDTTGRITTAVSGGTSPYRYTWNNGQTKSNLESLGVGNYRLLVQDVNGCRADTLKIALNATSRIALSTRVNPPSCLGINNGIVTITPTGNAPFRYTWEKGDTSNFALNLGVGSHKVRIRDAQGCLFDTSFTLSPEKQPLLASITAVPPRCFGARDGFINVQMLRVENPGISFRWNDGSNLEARRDLAPGQYAVTITDRLGCVWERDSIALIAPPALTHEVLGLGQITCHGDSTGFIELAIRGGNRPYRYNWIGSNSSGPSAYRLTAGDYRLFVQDENGCPLNLDFRLTQPSKLNAETNVQVGSICQADRSNVLSATASGGSQPYSYRWSTGATTSAIFNQAPDDYSVTITDANGCTISPNSIKLRNAGDPLQLTNFTVKDISCFGKRDGEVSATISGGTAPYMFVFNNIVNAINTSQTTARVSNLPADIDYQVLVVDSRGCQVSSAVRPINEPSRLRIRRDSLRNSVCGNITGGGIFVSSGGGTAPYTYQWYNQSNRQQVIATTEDLTQVGGGTYFAVVSDARMCSDTLSPANIQGNPPLRVANLVVNDVKCRGEASGGISVDIQGGKAPYRYEWNNRPGARTVSNLRAGAYNLRVIDADSCRTNFGPFMVSEPSNGIVVADTINPVACNGGASGSIAIGIRGGKAPYRWTWQNAQGQVLGLDLRRLSNLRAGQYSLLVSDVDNCSLFFTYTVTQAESIRANLEVVQPKGDLANGSITAKPSGGTPPYRYRWGNGSTESSLNNIPKGTYFLTITDSRNCQSGESVLVQSTSTVDFAKVATVRAFPNPTSDELQLEMQLHESMPLELELLDLRGRLIWRRRFGAQLKLVEKINLQELSTGIYLLRVSSQRRVLYVERVGKVGK